MNEEAKNNMTVADILAKKRLKKQRLIQKKKHQEDKEKLEISLIEQRQQEQKKQLIEEIAKVYIASIVCQKTGIARATLYRWLKEDPEFRKKFTTAQAEGRNAVNDLAELNLVNKIKTGDTKLTIFWLTHMHPKYTHPSNRRIKETEDNVLSPEKKAEINRRVQMWD